MHGSIAYAALDLSRRRDLTVWLLLVEKDGLLHLLPRIFTPAATLARKELDDKVPYGEWVKQGFVIATPGDTIRQEDLLPVIEQDNQDFRIASVRYDPWNADLLSQELEHRGYQMEEVRANSANAVLAPTVELERYFHRGLIRVPQNPCLKWCFQNAVLRRVGSDGVIINKAKSTARVDAAVASVLAMSGWMAAQDTGLADASWISFA